jgi:hypothetical protein
VRTSLFVLLAALLSAPVGATNSVCDAVTLPPTATPWNSTVTLSRFDPALGTLLSVHVILYIEGSGAVQLESQDTLPTTLATHVTVPVQVLRPDLSFLVGDTPYGDYLDHAAPFDGFVNFAGPSGFTHQPFNPQWLTGTTLQSVSDRELFTGLSGNPGTVTLRVNGFESILVTPTGGSFGPTFAGTIQDSLATTVTVTVCYSYEPGVGASFCAGDGSGTACPCGNSSAFGSNQGCTNSFGPGASLSAGGQPNVFNDTLTLQCSGLPVGTSALLFQGTQQDNLGSGTVFGDGLRCVGGTVRRLQTTHAVGSIASWPPVGAPTISTSGGAVSGQLLHYQVWYRNAAAFCTPASFNLSQGLSIAWVM